MPFGIIRNDITKVRADAIVNTANPKPRVGSGTDGAIYEAAGRERLLEARAKIGIIAPGHAAYTSAFGLPAKYIIHTVGPAWVDGRHGERKTLRACYARSLALAAELGCKSVAFPLISSGAYGFPKGEALDIALSEIAKFLLTHEMTVTLVVFDRRALELSEQVVSGIEQYIDDHAVRTLEAAEYGYSGPERRGQRRFRAPAEDEPLLTRDSFDDGGDLSGTDSILPAESAPAAGRESLDAVLDSVGETFQQRLFALIDASGMDEVTVYKKANIDRKVFSRIRCNKAYRPRKKTAVAFAIALELDLPSTLDLLSRAEFTFSPSSRFDLIVTYFITHKNYDIYEINAALFKYGQPILGE